MNVELLKQIDDAIAGRKYRFEWVRGHVGHVLNEAADARARGAAEAHQRGSAVPSGPGWTGDRERSANAVSAASASPSATPAESPSTDTADTLFDLQRHDVHELTVSLTDQEFARLQQRARTAGVTTEQFLRGLM
jgi:ribonuclease HI